MKKVLITLIVAFAFCGSIFAQQYQQHWPDVNYHLYQNNYPVVANVQIDDNLILGTDHYEALEVAAFIDDELRAHSFMIYNTSYNSNPAVQLDVQVHEAWDYGDPDDKNKVITFKLYDHINECEYDVFTSDPIVRAGYHYNNWSNPVILSFFHAFTKEITPYTGAGGYCFIASPLGMVVSPTDVTHMTDNTFDLYRFNQSADLEWENWKQEGDNYHFNLESGMGYLYANSGDGSDDPVVLTFIGAPYDGDGDVELVYDADAEFPGWNLVGNPFAQTASITKSYYTLNNAGLEVVAGESNEIGAMEGIFVVAANADDNSMTFIPSQPSQGNRQIVLNVNQDRGDVIDRAIVRFGGEKLPKFMLNPNNTKMYIYKDGNDYAVVNGSNNGKLPVCFKPAQDGEYTINVNVEDETVRYLHLIDKQAEVDVDLLATPSYSFEAKKADNADRFLLVFRKGISIFKDLFASREGDSFSFFSNGNWIINNEGEAILQVVDVEGRILSSEEINGSVSKRIEAAPGVYMLRLINGKDTKVQKIVVE